MRGGGRMALEWKHRPGDRCLLVETYAQWYSSLQGPDVGGEDGHFAFTGAEEDTVHEPKGRALHHQWCINNFG